MFESIITIAIVLIAVFFVGRRFLRSRKDDAGCGCGGCGGCGEKCGEGKNAA